MTGMERRAALQAERASALSARLDGLLSGLRGEERALDVGAGLGALAFALAPRVREVVAVELPGPAEPGTPVTIIGDGLIAEEHARHAGTITYELVTGLRANDHRTTRKVLDA